MFLDTIACRATPGVMRYSIQIYSAHYAHSKGNGGHGARDCGVSPQVAALSRGRRRDGGLIVRDCGVEATRGFELRPSAFRDGSTPFVE